MTTPTWPNLRRARTARSPSDTGLSRRSSGGSASAMNPRAVIARVPCRPSHASAVSMLGTSGSWIKLGLSAPKLGLQMRGETGSIKAHVAGLVGGLAVEWLDADGRAADEKESGQREEDERPDHSFPSWSAQRAPMNHSAAAVVQRCSAARRRTKPRMRRYEASRSMRSCRIWGQRSR